MMTIERRKPHIIKRLTYWVTALLLIAFSTPSIALADEVPPTEPVTTAETTPPATITETTPPPAEQTPTATAEPVTEPAPTTSTETQGPQSPPGAEADTYTFNETTGLWENSKYTWDPVTKQTSPKTAPTYSYNPETGHWDTTEWIYDAPSGTYVPNIISVIAPPEGAVVDETSKTSTNTLAPLVADSSSETTNTGPDSNNTIENNSKPTGIFDLFYNAFISNNINSTAITGDALVNMNTLAGNALSGDAKAITTIFNLLQSSWNLGLVGNAFTAFTQSIFGNLIGDLLLNPGQPQTSGLTVTPSDLTVNASTNAAINNTITLEAISGDAAVTSNTTAGDATTGSATAIANIINAINSSIIAGQSFVGMLNIYGSLNGDILLPPDLISTLLASNVVGTLDAGNIDNAEIIGNFDNNLNISNNINASATSGDSTVAQNTSAGNATTGDASTNVTLLNLTGRQVIGKNALLVFVNVLGTWVGMIVDAPTGATSAALGSGITTDSSLTINDSTNQAITNNVDIRARSGDALVSKNTSAGSATSGDADAAVNILDLNNSQFALSDWFGVLFINVFGSWTGSFGIDTMAGSLPFPIVNTSAVTPAISSENIRAFNFTPNTNGTYTLKESDEGVTALREAGVLSNTAEPLQEVQETASTSQRKADWLMTIIGVSVALSLLGTERVLSRRETK